MARIVVADANPASSKSNPCDSSRAGQLFNTEAYIGMSNPTYGELLAGRQNSLIVDAASRFDPMGAASSFSVIGVSNVDVAGTPRPRATTRRSNIALASGHFISRGFISSAASTRATPRTERFPSG
jgi:hypothetical protein